jgi:hypothetical protein
MMVHRIGKVDSLQEAELGCNTCTIEASVRIPVVGLILCEVVSVYCRTWGTLQVI